MREEDCCGIGFGLAMRRALRFLAAFGGHENFVPASSVAEAVWPTSPPRNPEYKVVAVLRRLRRRGLAIHKPARGWRLTRDGFYKAKKPEGGKRCR